MHPLRPHHPICLNREFRSDLAWWHLFIVQWNGVLFLPPPRWFPPITGCGAWHEAHWFQVQWDRTSLPLPIVVKERTATRRSCLWAVGGRLEWSPHTLPLRQPGSRSLPPVTSKNRHCLHMLRALAFIEARYCFHLQPQYINTRANHLADDLSRNNISSFFIQGPQCRQRPSAYVGATAGPPPAPAAGPPLGSDYWP